MLEFLKLKIVNDKISVIKSKNVRMSGQLEVMAAILKVSILVEVGGEH